MNSEWFIEKTNVEEKNKTYPYYDTEFSGKFAKEKVKPINLFVTTDECISS